jgi:hypothetical protein
MFIKESIFILSLIVLGGMNFPLAAMMMGSDAGKDLFRFHMFSKMFGNARRTGGMTNLFMYPLLFN